MRPLLADCVFIVLLAAIGGNPAIAAPVDFNALPLVPPGAQIVSGFLARQNRYKTGGSSLQLVTQNNILDLHDWVALAGVDPNRSFSEIIQVALAPPGDTLSEHLLLINGSFDREHIFRSAELNGAKPLKYLAEPVLAIEPFARERLDMTDTRWLAILEDRIVVFGTPWIVQQALNRFENRVPADPILMDRLGLLKPDVNCWNLVAFVPENPQAAFLESDGPWSILFDDTDFLILGIHADSSIRVDLSLQTNSKSETANLNGKAALFGRIFIREVARDEDSIRRLKNLHVNEKRITASVLLSAEDFLEWKRDQLNRNQQLIERARERKRAAASPNQAPTMSTSPH